MTELLNEPQLRALRGTLERLEELIERSRRLRAHQDSAPESVLIRHVENLTERQSTQLEEQEKRTLALLRQLHDDFDLQCETVNSKHHLLSQSALLGADLQEFLPNNWKGAGELNPQAKRILEERIPELIDAMQQLVDVLE